jgi:hypothetical protein
MKLRSELQIGCAVEEEMVEQPGLQEEADGEREGGVVGSWVRRMEVEAVGRVTASGFSPLEMGD